MSSEHRPLLRPHVQPPRQPGEHGGVLLPIERPLQHLRLDGERAGAFVLQLQRPRLGVHRCL
jgi:hypothetical protein